MDASSLPANPWLELPQSEPFALACDAERLRGFEKLALEEERFRLDVLPQPFVGRPDAGVVLLSMNPGYAGIDAFPELDEAIRANLAHAPQPYPFFYLDPAGKTPAHKWWQRRLEGSIATFGHEALASSVLCLEFYPYASETFSGEAPVLPSQTYTFALLRAALARNAAIMVLSGESYWRTAVPEITATARRNTTTTFGSPATFLRERVA